MRSQLRARIINQLNEQGEITSVFKFLCDQGCNNYAFGMLVFRTMQLEGLINMSKTSERGRPWKVTRVEECPAIQAS